jgi:hypothetical protein
MIKKAVILFCLALLGFTFRVSSQINLPKVVQVTGVVLISDSLYPASFVSIYRSRDKRGTYSNKEGYFTLPVIAGVTLLFTCAGLEDSYFIIPKETADDKLSMVQIMNVSPFELPTAYILPYPAKNRLRAEVLALDLPGDYYVSWKRESNSMSNYDGSIDFSKESYQSASLQMQRRYSGGLYTGGNLLDADSWKKFIKTLND